LEISDTGFYGSDAFPVSQPTVSKLCYKTFVSVAMMWVFCSADCIEHNTQTSTQKDFGELRENGKLLKQVENCRFY